MAESGAVCDMFALFAAGSSRKGDQVKLTIDNQNGAGPIDYTSAISAARPLLIERTLNAPSTCAFVLAGCGSVALPVPARNGRAVVTDDAGGFIFTGYLPQEPAMEYQGLGTTGAVYEAAISAVSDEFVLDKQNLPQTNGTSGQTVAAVFGSLTSRVGTAAVSIGAPLQTLTLGHFVPDPGKTWSQNAGALAFESRAAYRSLAGGISLMPIGSVAHTLNESDGSLQIGGLTASRAKMLANDVTICGAVEPCAYVSEIFQGDGSTALFELSRLPFLPVASKAKPFKDTFQEPAVNPLLWYLNDAGSRFSITSNGLTAGGGDGVDGQTTVSTIDQIEIGGSLIVETDGVLITTAGSGILCGLYSGIGLTIAECFAGFQVQQVSGAAIITPVLNGVLVGGSFTPTTGHAYTLRLRLHCNEAQRVMESYQCLSGGSLTTFGGAQVPCLAQVVMEIQDVTSGANGAVTVLYDGSTMNSPAACSFVPISSVSLFVTVRNVVVSQTGSVWVVSQPPGSATVTRRLGAVTKGAQCRMQTNSKLRFYEGSVPVAGELITVSYRTSQQSVARLANSASIAAETQPGMPGISRWSGSAVRPQARSSADCESAALAMLTFASDRNAAWQGQYTAYNLQNGVDVWPGDVLAVASSSAGLTANLVVRAVRVEIANGMPETARYTMQFANDWADELSMKLTDAVPSTAWIPPVASAGVVVLGNLLGLTVGAVTGTSIAISCGQSPPASGGFEVRRTDWAFRPGSDPDLVLRSPVPNLSIPREGSNEQYYVRMYDSSTPPRYSRFSSAVFVNVP